MVTIIKKKEISKFKNKSETRKENPTNQNQKYLEKYCFGQNLITFALVVVRFHDRGEKAQAYYQ